LYTVPGDVEEGAIWKNVLKGADGIVFVADLDSSRTLENRRSFEDLTGYLVALDTEFAEVPCIFQFNKKDVEGASTPDDLKNLLDAGDIPVMPAAAGSGEGVLPTLSEMVKLILQKLRDAASVSEELASPVVVDEPAGQDAPPVEEAAQTTEAPYAFAEETETVVSYAEEEERVRDEEPAEEISLSEEPVTASDDEGITPDEPEPLGVADVLPDEELVSPSVSEEESFEMPEPEPCGESFSLETATAEPDFDASEPEISLEGDLEFLGEGRYRLPLVIRYADKEKRTALTLSLGIE